MDGIKLNKIKFNNFIYNLKFKNINYSQTKIIKIVMDMYDLDLDNDNKSEFIDVLIDDIENINYDLIKKIFEFVILMFCYITVKDINENLELIKKLKDKSEIVWKEIRAFNDMNLNVP